MYFQGFTQTGLKESILYNKCHLSAVPNAKSVIDVIWTHGFTETIDKPQILICVSESQTHANPQTHTGGTHVATIFLPWVIHAIIMCNIKVSGRQEISQQQEAGFSWREHTDWRVLVQSSIKIFFFDRASLLRNDMPDDSIKQDIRFGCSSYPLVDRIPFSVRCIIYCETSKKSVSNAMKS